jgi:hypothetical protein
VASGRIDDLAWDNVAKHVLLHVTLPACHYKCFISAVKVCKSLRQIYTVSQKN